MMFNLTNLKFSARSPWAFLAVACVALSGCDQPVNTPVASQNLQDIKAPVIYGMTSYLTAQGVRQGEVQADTAYMFNDSSVVKRMHVVFYDANGQERAAVTAAHGTLFRRSERMDAYGHVVLVIPSQGPTIPERTIRTAELHYDPSFGRGRIWSDSATLMVQGSDTTRGTAFRSDLDFKNVKVENPRGAVGSGVF